MTKWVTTGVTTGYKRWQGVGQRVQAVGKGWTGLQEACEG